MTIGGGKGIPPSAELWLSAVGGGILRFGGGIEKGGGCESMGRVGTGRLTGACGGSFSLSSISFAFFSLLSVNDS